MFHDFFSDTVDIYKMQRNTSNRVNKEQMANSQLPMLMQVPCRIHDDKVLIAPEVVLAVGDVIEDKADGEQYEIVEKRKARGVRAVHHRSYTIKRRAIPSEWAEDRN